MARVDANGCARHNEIIKIDALKWHGAHKKV